MTSVKMSNYNPSQPFAIGKVSYNSNYTLGYDDIPKSYTASEFYIHLEKEPIIGTDGVAQDPEYLSITQSVENEDIEPTVTADSRRDIAIEVKDFATEVVIVGASIFIDGSLVGVTNEQGIMNAIGVSVGDHAIRITAPGYLDSDEDELANDTFTVTADEDDISGQIIP
jgi:hypothetical protein